MNSKDRCRDDGGLLRLWPDREDYSLQPPHPPLRGRKALLDEVVGDQPVAEFRIVPVHIDSGVDQVRLVPFPLTDRVRPPGVVRLFGEPQNPTGDGDGDPVGCQVADQRVEPFGGSSLAK